jgi:hypothetical protein
MRTYAQVLGSLDLRLLQLLLNGGQPLPCRLQLLLHLDTGLGIGGCLLVPSCIDGGGSEGLVLLLGPGSTPNSAGKTSHARFGGQNNNNALDASKQASKYEQWPATGAHNNHA